MIAFRRSAHTDALLQAHRDEWTPVYQACRLAEEGIALDAFLAAPWQHLVEHGQESCFASHGRGFRPLLPRQAAVARRIRSMDLRSRMSLLH